jgi:hypothetical protein
VLTRIFEVRSDEVRGETSKLHNEELNNLYTSRSVLQVIKLEKMRWAGHVGLKGERRVT